MRAQGKSRRAIARALGRDVSTISRELKRNSNKDGSYNVWRATSLYLYRRKKCKRNLRIVFDADLRAYVCEKLSRYWSAETISLAWNKLHPEARVGHTTIYSALKKKLLCGYSERTHLMRRGLTKYSRGATNAVKPTRNIAERPEAAQLRSEKGHWEGDTVRGKMGTGGLATFTDRMDRKLKMVLIQGAITAQATTRATCEALGGQVVRSITLDNGSEFAEHRKIEAQLGAPVYFTDPHSPWQRPTNENTNGLLRFFFPKGFDFNETTPEYVAEVEELFNTRPRKCLGGLAPADFLAKCCT